mgnify:FL=1|tara:strand:+ start:663 stop:1319 length:657 start_codon:yes stop_codon:yes gene_type:complete
MDSAAVENYLKSLWQLGSEDISTLDLAHHLDVSPASATKMIKRLTEKGLVSHTPYRGASLTLNGEKKALSVVRRHRLLETFLSHTLKLNSDQIHDEAERLEHALSPELETAISDYLGNPVRDPHGHLIPGPNGEISKEYDLALTEAPHNVVLTVTQVPDRNSEMLGWLRKQKILPGTKLVILSEDKFGDSLIIKLNTKDKKISLLVAGQVFVSTEENI